MKKIVSLIILAIAAFVIYSYTNRQNDKTFKKEALDAKMITSDGGEIAFKDILKKYKRKTVVIDVWATWCSDCIKGMPKVKELQTQFPNVTYLFLSLDKTPEAWKKGIEKHDVKGEHYLAKDGMKGIFGKSIDLNWIPRYMVVDKNGKIALFKAIEADDTKLIETLKKIN